MNNTFKNIAIGILIAVVALLLARYVFFKERFEEWGRGLERVGAWQEEYKRQNPNATKEETDAAFDAGIAQIRVWKEKYKQDHPGATDADADAAFNAAWKK